MTRHRAALPLAALAAACGGPAEKPPEAPAVEVVEARRGRLPRAERVNGVVKAENQVEVRPEIEAVVAEVLVRTGDTVRRGQPLVRLREDELRDQLRQADAAIALELASARAARARVEELRTQVESTRQLAEQELVSRVQMETLEAQLAVVRAEAQQADARVAQARATAAERRRALAKTVIRAPAGGRVGRRQVEPGQLVTPATLMFELGNLDRLRVEVPLTGEMLRRVRPGQPALVRSDVLGAEPARATLSRVSPFLAPTSFSTTGEIDLPNPGGLSPGTFVTVDILHGESDEATLVPASALWEDPRTGNIGVFVAKPAAAPTDSLSPDPVPVELRAVTVEGEEGGAAGVAGVAPGEWVITVGQHLVGTGGDARVRVRRTTWERVAALQDLEREDLLRGFMDKQRRVARTLGAAPPTTEEVRALASPGPGAEP
jgi:RND family efflux transporter MFP subunit